MKFERQLVDYVSKTAFGEIPSRAVEAIKTMILADIGTTIAGARSDGCLELNAFFQSQGGTPEASILLHGGRLPAQNAVFVNSAMSRALDFCDAIAPGPHIGSSTIPTALACAELTGGCSGEEFLSALIVGAEVAVRMNLNESAYDGFDPTGICVPFGAAAVACRLLKLDKAQTWNAFGLVFNSCGGSFQGHIDGSLGVRINQGRSAHEAVISTRLAQTGITGPKNFLTGIYGYLHVYGKGQFTGADVVEGLGESYRMQEIAYKKYPCCSLASGPTDLTINMLNAYELDPGDIQSVQVSLSPYGYRLIGHEFKIGDNPTVDGQFNAQYCVANVLLRGRSKLRHFTAPEVRDPDIRRFISKVTVVSDPSLIRRGHTAVDIQITMSNGQVFKGGIDVAPGFPGNPLTEADHRQRFLDCIDFASDWFLVDRAEEIIAYIDRIEHETDVRSLISLLNKSNVLEASLISKRHH